jgi:hypothetical protein
MVPDRQVANAFAGTPQCRSKDVDESGGVSPLRDIHRALTESILQDPPSAKFDQPPHDLARPDAGIA